MEDRINEVEIKNSEIKEVDISLTKVVKSICKITYGNKCGSGFLIKLYNVGKELFCLMTNHHVITKELVDSKEMINKAFTYPICDMLVKPFNAKDVTTVANKTVNFK